MAADLLLRIFDVEHGACAILGTPNERIAMIDCGHNSSTGWRPSEFIRYAMGLDRVHYFFVSNADRDHLSDCVGLREHGVHVEALVRNPSPCASALRILKEVDGPLHKGVERFLEMHDSYNSYASPFNETMGGVTCSTFCSRFPAFSDTNNLSMATFIKYGGVKFLFPGDLEKAGWKALLQNPAFIAELRHTDVLIASHHGRENGFCKEVFNFVRPQVVVISDTAIQYESQEVVPDYRGVVLNQSGVKVLYGSQVRQRRVLTTRCDGDIIFRVTAEGKFYISTTKNKYRQKAA